MGSSKKDSLCAAVLHPRILLALPIVVYLVSYVYLVCYHGQWFLWNRVVHEGGTYTLLQTTLYASHFLGHVPVLTVLALYFTGVWLALSGEINHQPPRASLASLTSLLFLFLAVTFVVSLQWFGPQDTWSFVLQNKQSVVRYGEGGSWNLHLPSTLMQFLLIPLYIFVCKSIFRSASTPNQNGNIFIGLSLALFLLMSWAVNDGVLAAISYVWKDPRYLAHSVRELATFPLTYYPIPLYFFLRDKRGSDASPSGNLGLRKMMAWLGVLFLGLFTYQVLVPLSEGIGQLAQKPSFASDGELSIGYLLSAHYFEHFLDTIYFALLALILYRLAQKKRAKGKRI